MHCALGRGTGGWQHLAARLDLRQPNSPVVIAACCALRKPGTASMGRQWGDRGTCRHEDRPQDTPRLLYLAESHLFRGTAAMLEVLGRDKVAL